MTPAETLRDRAARLEHDAADTRELMDERDPPDLRREAMKSASDDLEEAAALRAGAEAIEALALAEGVLDMDIIPHETHENRRCDGWWAETRETAIGDGPTEAEARRALAGVLIATALRLVKEADDGAR